MRRPSLESNSPSSSTLNHTDNFPQNGFSLWGIGFVNVGAAASRLQSGAQQITTWLTQGITPSESLVERQPKTENIEIDESPFAGLDDQKILDEALFNVCNSFNDTDMAKVIDALRAKGFPNLRQKIQEASEHANQEGRGREESAFYSNIITNHFLDAHQTRSPSTFTQNKVSRSTHPFDRPGRRMMLGGLISIPEDNTPKRKQASQEKRLLNNYQKSTRSIHCSDHQRSIPQKNRATSLPTTPIANAQRHTTQSGATFVEKLTNLLLNFSENAQAIEKENARSKGKEKQQEEDNLAAISSQKWQDTTQLLCKHSSNFTRKFAVAEKQMELVDLLYSNPSQFCIAIAEQAEQWHQQDN